MVVNTNAKKFDVYIDGKLRRTGCAFNQSSVNGIVIGSFDAGSMTYDNVKISVGDKVYLDENFDDMATGTMPNGWACTTKGGKITIVNDPGGQGKSCCCAKDIATNLSAVMAVPGLSEVADRDEFMLSEVQADGIAVSTMPMREKHGLVAGYIMTDTLHPAVENQEFNQLWIKTILNLRIPPTVPTDKVVEMKPLKEDMGFLGRLEYHKQLKDNVFERLIIDKKEIFPYSKFPYPKAEGHWLPNAEVAEAWLQMMNNRTEPKKYVDWMESN
jgi:hypothetical protein